MRIDLSCAACGGNRLSLDKDVDDTSTITCKECGHEIGTMADLKQMVAAEVLERNSFRKQPL